MNQLSSYPYSQREEILHGLTHMIGIVFGFFALFHLTYSAYQLGSVEQMISYCVYSISMIILFSASTIYHLTKDINLKKIFKKLDHMAIYIFIAGCYTPILISYAPDKNKYIYLMIVWLAGSVGVVYKIFNKSKKLKLSVLTYLTMGYICLLIKDTVLNQLPNNSQYWLYAGGAFYGVGVLFYIAKKMPYHHVIWHLFVLFGTFSHYMTIATSMR